MIPTNYHLFDFMDFDPSLKCDEALWKAYAPSHIEEHDGDIRITLPYQRQRRQSDMAADESVPQQEYVLTVRGYSQNILRLYTSMNGDTMVEEDDMLQFSPEVKRVPLALQPLGEGREGYKIVTNDSDARVCHDAGGTPTRQKVVGIIDLTPHVLDHWSDLLPAPQPAPAITFFPDGNPDKPIVLSDDHFSPPRYDALPLGFVSCNKNTAYGKAERATVSFRCSPGECFAGTGERFRKMDLSGSTFFLKNQDGQGVNNSRCYKNIPFYLSSRIYGAFFHTSDYCKLDLANHSTRSVQFLNHRATIDVFLIGGITPEEVLRGYRMLTGFPQMPPLWSFGIWMSRMTYFSADEVEDICQRLRQEHYPCDVIHLDTGWFRTDWLCEWRFNPERFPNPEAFIHRLADQGFKVSLWQLPYISAEAEQYEEARDNEYISQPKVRPQDLPGKGAEAQDTQGESNFSSLDYAGTIDFTNPAAVRWYQEQLLGPLLKMGVKCIKTDFGENIHTEHRYHGMSPERLNNLYALLYQRAAWESLTLSPAPHKEREAGNESCLWSRAAWAGCQRYPIHWGGDSESSWDGMAGSLKGGLHLGLSGFAFWSHDVPGFHSTPDFMNSPVDPTIYVRWTQFGVFTSHIRYHGTSKREPWHYPDVAPIVKSWWKLRYRLLPYIVEQSGRCCKSGMPMLQALLLRHPDDNQVWHIDDEYYFGEEFLVCPVMNSEGRRDIYLPACPSPHPSSAESGPSACEASPSGGSMEGTWVNFFTGERLKGGRWYYGVETPLEQMPVFVRESARIPLYPDDVDSTDDMNLAKTAILEITPDFKGYPMPIL